MPENSGQRAEVISPTATAGNTPSYIRGVLWITTGLLIVIILYIFVQPLHEGICPYKREGFKQKAAEADETLHENLSEQISSIKYALETDKKIQEMNSKFEKVLLSLNRLEKEIAELRRSQSTAPVPRP